MATDQYTRSDPRTLYPTPPYGQQQEHPGCGAAMSPVPDHGEESYWGSGRLTESKTIVTGGDSGIGRAEVLGVTGGSPVT